MMVDIPIPPLDGSLRETPTRKIAKLFADVVFTPVPTPSKNSIWVDGGHQPSTIVLKKGHVKEAGLRPFPSDVIFERDTTIILRDGIKLYADIFRPMGSDKCPVPAILPWSPYGKTGSGAQHYDNMVPFYAGYSREQWSGYHKFEGPDPAEWCRRDYAIINVDARGAGYSEGNIALQGLQEAEDVYDVISWASTQPWCNGSVAMAGNSWLAMSQINFAARLSHPALKALAPWEALTDPYNHVVARGGFKYVPKFLELLRDGFAGSDSFENMYAMFDKRPMYDEYWEAKRTPVECIDDVPIYILASYSSLFHPHGSFETFEKARTKAKWLRIHPYQEWYDLYRPEMVDDLQKFFDRYCKGVQNGWEEETPPVRLSLLGFEADGSPAKTILERPELEYPLAREKMRDYYLDACSGNLSETLPALEASTSYHSHSMDDRIEFNATFNDYTELAGYSKLKVFVSCIEKDDMDVVCQIRKIDASGRPLTHLNFPCPVPVAEVADEATAKTLGPQGFLRASHAVSLDESKSKGNNLYYSHRRRESIPRGTIVELQIPLWPIGMVFAPGEGIQLRISGHSMDHAVTGHCKMTEPMDDNLGVHTVYTGGMHASVLTVPIIS